MKRKPDKQEAVRVTFANYVKRWKSENDTVHAERKAKYAKNRRRWARKDLVSPDYSRKRQVRQQEICVKFGLCL
jgi:hypothetical protein